MSAFKERSNQIVKILICLALTFVFIFVQPKKNIQEAEAIAPLLVWAGWMIAGVVAEEALQMGIKHITDGGKSKTKSKTKKIADEILGELDGFDFDNNNLKRKADGSLEMDMSANDRAKIARKIADEFGEVITFDKERRDKLDDDYADVVVEIYEETPYNITNAEAFELVSKFFYIDVYSHPTLGNQGHKEGAITSSISNVIWHKELLSPGVNKLTFGRYGGGAPNYTNNMYMALKTPSGSTYGNYHSLDALTIAFFEKYKLAKQLGSDVYTFDGMAVPQTIENVYPVGTGYNGDLPNKQELSNKPYKIPNFFPSGSDEDVTWEVLEQNYYNDSDTENKFEQNVETYLENGDINNNTYTYNTQNINNYYTDTNYPVKSADIENEINIDIDITVPTVPGETDVDVDGFKYCVEKSSGQVVPCKDIEAIDGGLLAYVRDSYNYASSAVKTAVDGLESIATGSAGLVALYSEIFDWLPDEVTVLLTSGLMLMIGLRVFRK